MGYGKPAYNRGQKANPAAYQDGKFASVFNKNVVNWVTPSSTSVSASGNYTISTTSTNFK